ncbi:MAG: hypothetical protein WC208_01330 [Gallionella sp.]
MSELSVIELTLPPDDFLHNEPEGAAFHKAFLASGIRGFKCGYLAISRGDLRIAVAPFFLSAFSLGTLLPDGPLKKSLAWIKLSYACVGHPSTDFGMIDGEISADILALVNATLAKKAPLIAYKGFAGNLPLPGFIKVRGLPVSVLNIRGDYYSQLDARRRNDFRHKLQAASALRIEEYGTLPEHLITPVYQLYLNTLMHATVRFEILTPEYFRQAAGLGLFHLYFEGERLIGFLQIITNGKKANLKYMGMDHAHNRPYFLYFAMCLRGIKAGMTAGCTRIELGVSSYQAKHLIGADLIETAVYYRHSNALIHWLLGKCKFLIEPKMDELR